MRLSGASALVVAVLLLLASPAGATWSVVGVDPDTNQVGVAVASCVPIEALDTADGFELIALVPGVGAGITQAFYNPDARVEIEALLAESTSADAIIEAITDPEFDGNAADRQHAVVLLSGETAGFTGANTEAVARDLQGNNVSVQGNILVSDAVLDDSLAAFETDDELPLAERLVNALEAGSLAGGDSRCGAQTALFAHVSVIDGFGTRTNPNIVSMTVAADEGSGENPVVELADSYRLGTRFITAPFGSTTGGFLLAAIPIVLLATAAAASTIYRRRRLLDRTG